MVFVVQWQEKIFRLYGEADFRGLEGELNRWISRHDCWLEIDRVEWRTVFGLLHLVVYYAEEQCSLNRPPRTRAEVLFGPRDAAIARLAALDAAEVGYLASDYLDRGDALGVLVVLERAFVRRWMFGRQPERAQERLNRWLSFLPATQQPRSIVSLDDKVEVTVDMGFDPVPRATEYSYTAQVFFGSRDEVEDSIRLFLEKFDDRSEVIVSNVVKSMLLPCHAIVLFPVCRVPLGEPGPAEDGSYL